MRTTSIVLPAMLLFSACGSMQETVQVRDDVYDIPDRTAMASVDPVAEPASDQPGDDYYDPNAAAEYKTGTYWDQTYNDPSWYNQGRFGFGVSVSNWGAGYGMGMSYGNNGWGMYNSPTGMYDPYWGNSWQSGYGAWSSPYGYYNPYSSGYYDPWGWNNSMYYGYGGCNTCYSCAYGGGGGWYGSGYGGSYIVAHRPSMGGGGNTVGGGSGGTGPAPTTRSIRGNDIGLLRPVIQREKQADADRSRSDRQVKQSDRSQRPEPKERKERSSGGSDNKAGTLPTFNSGTSGGGGRGGGGGSSPTTSPRPHR